MITLTNGRGITVHFNKKGAAIDQLIYCKRVVADKGVTVGRYANRIAKGRFSIGDNMYQLTTNENGNTLHGGLSRLQDREWRAELLDDFGQVTNDETCACGVRFTITSVDGDQGFPGNLKLSVTYELTPSNELAIKYEARSDKDTVVNFTNHAYFNMNGGGDVHDQTLWVDTNAYTEVDAQLIPTGRILPTEGTDFNLIDGGKYKADLDFNFVLNGSGLRRVACLTGNKTGYCVTCFTDQPGLQIYNDKERVCLETQHFPDSPNHPDFPSTLLKAGCTFKSTTIYKFSKS